MKVLLLLLTLTTPIEHILAGVEHTPTADEVKRLGADADQQLIDYAESPRATPIRRMRAILALRFVPSATARAYLSALLARQPGALDTAAALSALTPYGRDVLAQVQPYLVHPAADVRHAAVAAMTQLGALAPLRARLAVEKDPGVHAEILRALTPR
jgi:hypothetical protein